jgi:hypothetical protein
MPEETASPIRSSNFFAKVVVAILPPTILRQFNVPHQRLLFSLSLVLGILLQALIPPRRMGLWQLLLLASLLGLSYYAWTSR